MAVLLFSADRDAMLPLRSTIPNNILFCPHMAEYLLTWALCMTAKDIHTTTMSILMCHGTVLLSITLGRLEDSFRVVFPLWGVCRQRKIPEWMRAPTSVLCPPACGICVRHRCPCPTYRNNEWSPIPPTSTTRLCRIPLFCNDEISLEPNFMSPSRSRTHCVSDRRLDLGWCTQTSHRWYDDPAHKIRHGRDALAGGLPDGRGSTRLVGGECLRVLLFCFTWHDLSSVAA